MKSLVPLALVPLAIAFALIGSGAAQAAPPEDLSGNQSTETRQPSATGQSSEQSTQGAEAQSPAPESVAPAGPTVKRDQGESLSAEEPDALNQLLENELSSVESYERALEKFRPEGDHETLGIYQQLTTIRQDHQDAVLTLKTQVQQAGGTPTGDSGAGGIWAKIIMGSAALLGNKTALEALKQGEEDSLKEYQQILQRENIPSQTSSLVQTTLLPRQQTHVAQLDSLIQEVERLEATAENAEEKAKEAEDEAEEEAEKAGR